MKSLIFLAIIALALSSENAQLEMIKKINEMNTTWKAGTNFRFDKEFDVKNLLGTFLDKKLSDEVTVRTNVREDLPKEYDLREEYPKCESLKEIRDQANCGSCWAFGAAEVISDRICIESKGKLQPRVSTTDLVTCCDFCGEGCNGGYPLFAFGYWTSNGIPTGGLYGDTDTCKPYFLPPCDHHVDGEYGPCPETVETPKCEKKCQKKYPTSYKDDLIFGRSAYGIGTEKGIMTEIYEHGSVEAAFEVFEDFLLYKEGIYQNVEGESLGGHAVKVIGWGEEEGVKYWLCVNSWNEGWGEEGLFRILRGKNECGIEDQMYAGQPIIPEEYLIE